MDKKILKLQATSAETDEIEFQLPVYRLKVVWLNESLSYVSPGYFIFSIVQKFGHVYYHTKKYVTPARSRSQDRAVQD